MSNAWKFTDGPNFETIIIVKFPCKCLRSVNPIKPGFKWIHTGMILWILCMLFWCTWAKRKWATPLGSHLFWQVLGQVKQKNIMTQNSTQQNKTSNAFDIWKDCGCWCVHTSLKQKRSPHPTKKKHISNSIFWDLDMLDLSLDTLDFSTQDWLLPAFDAGGASRQTLLAGIRTLMKNTLPANLW